MNSVDYLLEIKTWTYEDRIQIKNLGRPTPELNLSEVTKTKARNYQRNFNVNTYEKYAWICGCSVRNKLFCFVCILMGGEASAWTKSGVSDLKHLNERATKHSQSSKHLSNVIDFKVLGRVNIRQQLDSAFHESIRKHNAIVDKNRHILSQLINCIKFCGAFELALRGHDEKSGSENRGIFLGLVDFVAELDMAMQTHLKDASVFKGTSKTIQNELLDTMLQVCRQEIKSQVNSANYLAIEADESTDVSNQQQLVLILRYVYNEEVYERFWGLKKPLGYTADKLSEAILDELAELNIPPEKLVAQTYDGAAVMSGKHNSVQTKIREKYPNAYFLHCYSHQFNLLIQKAASSNKNVKVFFANIQAFSSFFSLSPKRTAVLDEIVKKRLPRAAPTRWNFKSRVVNVVYENKDLLLECLDLIIDDSSDQKTINEASGLINYLNNDDFLFWLEVFHNIMPHVDILFNQTQLRGVTSSYLNQCIDAFEHEIRKLRDNIDSITVNSSILKQPRKPVLAGDHRNVAAKEVCDVIITQIQDRFHFKDHLAAARLFLPENFTEYRKAFPEEIFKITIMTYKVFNNSKLKTELGVLYERNDMCTMQGVCALMKFISNNDLIETFSETYKLLCIIVTTPMTTAECERCFSTLKRIKTFLRNTMSQDRLNALAMLSIEKTLINKMPNFNTKVIDTFSGLKNRRADFTYR